MVLKLAALPLPRAAPSFFGNAGCTNTAHSRFSTEGEGEGGKRPRRELQLRPSPHAAAAERGPGRRCFRMKKKGRRGPHSQHACQQHRSVEGKFCVLTFSFFLLLFFLVCLINALPREPPRLEKVLVLFGLSASRRCCLSYNKYTLKKPQNL